MTPSRPSGAVVPNMSASQVNVRYQGQPGRHLLVLSSSQFDPLLTSLSDWSRMSLAAWPRSAALKVRQVGRGRIWILLDRLQVFLDHLQHRPRRPAEQRANLQVLMGIHFDVVDL